MEWLPIETAPTDGTEVLLLFNNKPYVGRFQRSETYEHGKLVRSYGGWLCYSMLIGNDVKPTHWAMLPAIRMEGA